MTHEHLPRSMDPPPITTLVSPKRRTVASYKRMLTAYKRTEIRRRKTPARDDVLLRQTDELIQNPASLSKESDQRLLNDLQVIVCLFSLHGRASANAEVGFVEHRTSERA